MFEEFKEQGSALEPFANRLDALLSECHDGDIEGKIDEYLQGLLAVAEEQDETFRLSATNMLIDSTNRKALTILESWYGKDIMVALNCMITITNSQIFELIDTKLKRVEQNEIPKISGRQIYTEAIQHLELSKRVAQSLSEMSTVVPVFKRISPENPQVLIGIVRLAITHLDKLVDEATGNTTGFMNHSSDFDIMFVICELCELEVVSPAQKEMVCDYVG